MRHRVHGVAVAAVVERRLERDFLAADSLLLLEQKLEHAYASKSVSGRGSNEAQRTKRGLSLLTVGRALLWQQRGGAG